jgi:hypothetical protein
MRKFEPKGLARTHHSSLSDKSQRDVSIDSPVPRPIGIRQRAARYPTPESCAVEVWPQRPQARLDVAKALAKGQLRECHAQELIAATEITQAMVAAATLYACVELMPWNPVHQLSEASLRFSVAKASPAKDHEKGLKTALFSSFRDRRKNSF